MRVIADDGFLKITEVEREEVSGFRLRRLLHELGSPWAEEQHMVAEFWSRVQAASGLRHSGLMTFMEPVRGERFANGGFRPGFFSDSPAGRPLQRGALASARHWVSATSTLTRALLFLHAQGTVHGGMVESNLWMVPDLDVQSPHPLLMHAGLYGLAGDAANAGFPQIAAATPSTIDGDWRAAVDLFLRLAPADVRSKILTPAWSAQLLQVADDASAVAWLQVLEAELLPSLARET